MMDLVEFLDESVAHGKRQVHKMETEIDGKSHPIDGTCSLYELEAYLELCGYSKYERKSEAELVKEKGYYYKILKTKLGIRMSIRNSKNWAPPSGMAVVFSHDGKRIVEMKEVMYDSDYFGGVQYRDIRDFRRVLEYILGVISI